VTDESVGNAIVRIETDLKYIKRDVRELKETLKPVRSPVLPVTGGLVGVLAMVWTAYLQATGQG
jgi:hypothetical protein